MIVKYKIIVIIIISNHHTSQVVQLVNEECKQHYLCTWEIYLAGFYATVFRHLTH